MSGTVTFGACVIAMVFGGGASVAQPTGPELSGSIVRVPMNQVEGQIVVPVLIDGQGPFAFRVDTGSAVPLAIGGIL